MNNSNTEARFDGNNDRSAGDGSDLYSLGGVLPRDFPQRLEGLKEASGLSWGAMARAIGVDRKSLKRWHRKGTEPCGGAMHAIFRFAKEMPGGLDILMDEDFQPPLFDDEEES